jgi:hypothetical protein
MTKHANYMILPEFRLILECCKGQTSVEEGICMKKNELADILYNPDYFIIVDLQEFETSLDYTINTSITSFYDFLNSLGLKSKIAILTAAPHQVVISMILKELSATLGEARIEVFSTVQAAIRFLGFPAENFESINRKITELNKSTL